MADKYLLQYTGSQVDSRLEVPKPVSQGGTGQSSVTVQEDVTLDTSTASDHSITVKRFPYLGMCFIRASFKVTGTAVAANTYFNVATVDSSIAPLSNTALSVAAANGGSAMMSTNGELRVSFETAQTETQARNVYVSGWWMVQ